MGNRERKQKIFQIRWGDKNLQKAATSGEANLITEPKARRRKCWCRSRFGATLNGKGDKGENLRKKKELIK